jgi:putative transposase
LPSGNSRASRYRDACIILTAPSNTHLASIERCLPIMGSWVRKAGGATRTAKAESFMKTLEVEAVYPMAFETFNDVADQLPRFIDDIYNQCRLHSALGYVSPAQFEQRHSRLMVNSAA